MPVHTKNWLKEAIDFAQNHIKKPVDIEAFLRKIPLPSGHFSRLFHAAYGMTFSHYIRRLKQFHAIKAYLELNDKNAIKPYGFKGLEALKQSLNLKDQDTIDHKILNTLSLPASDSIPKHVALEKPQILKVEAKDFVGILSQEKAVFPDVKALASKLNEGIKAFNVPYTKEKTYGLMAPIRDSGFQLEQPNSGGFDFMCAKAVSRFDHLPKGFQYRMLPQREYALFQASIAHVDLKSIYYNIYAHALFDYNLTYDEDYVFEVHHETQKETPVIEIYVPVLSNQ